MADDQEPIFKTIEPTDLQYQETPISIGVRTKVFQGSYKDVPVAVKVMLTPAKKPFLRELRILNKLKSHDKKEDHDNIVDLVGVIQYPEVDKIVTRFLPGGTLRELLDRGPLPLQQALGYALDIARAMKYMHQKKIVHRDLKPENILLTEKKDRAVLIDFGLSREEDVSGMTVGVGSFRWIAPEVIRDRNGKWAEIVPYDHKADVYSFSIVLWQLITSRTPYQGLGIEEVLQRVKNNTLRPSIEGVIIPLELAMLLTSCWAPKPADRPEFSDIVSTLDAILRGDNQIEDDPGSDGQGGNKPKDDDPDEKKAKKKKGRGFNLFKGCLFPTKGIVKYISLLLG